MTEEPKEKVIRRRRWIQEPHTYVEVYYHVRPLRSNWVDIYCFIPDRRKLQYHKIKYRVAGSTHTSPAFFLGDDWSHYQNPFYVEAKKMVKGIQDGLSRTSSDRRAAAS